ncbi:tetratricopeptide repeat protein [Streptomyces sp. NPDC055749]
MAEALLEALADDSRSDHLFGVYEESRPGVAEALRLRRVLDEMRLSGGVDQRWRRDLVRRLADVAAVDPDAVSELRTFFPSAERDREAVRPPPPPQPSSQGARVHNSARGGTFTGPVQGSGVQHNYYGPGAYAPLPDVAHWPRLGQAAPIALGVRRTRRLPDEPTLPPYITRDCDERLGALVRAAAGPGGLVLVTGAPMSGKTRTAWAALFSNMAGTTRIYAPPPGADLRGLPAVLRGRGDETCVLWLDDLEGHLGENGLSAPVLAELVQQHTVVIATMADEAYDAHRFGVSASARLLSGVDSVELNRDWTATEWVRFTKSAGDLRLRGARFGRGATGITEYLAIGPELGDLWRRALRAKGRRRGHLLVRATIDLARCGVHGPIAVDVLRRAATHQVYGGWPLGEGETFEAALAWAAEIRLGVTGMLVPGRDFETWLAYGSLVADVEDQGPEAPPVPLGLWAYALEAVGDDDEKRTAVVTRARQYLTPRADGDQRTLMTLGSLERAVGETQAAESWFRKAADVGSAEGAGEVGRLLAARGAEAEAIPYLETAAAAGDVTSQRVLGTVLGDRARYWLTRAAEAGNGEAACRLGHLLLGSGQAHEAMRWYRTAADNGYEEVARTLGNLFHDWQELDEAEIWYRRAIANGDTGASNNLALLLEERDGPADEIERLYRTGAEAGDISAPVNLGSLLKARGQLDEARRWLAKGHELRNYDGAYALAELEREQGNTAAAEEWFGKALELGHHAAERALAELRSEGGEAAANVEG